MSGCHGLGQDHCCYIEGKVCPFLEMNTEPDRRWTCGLRRELGDWDRVHADPRYQEVVAPVLIRNGTGTLCGDFGPVQNQCCWGQYTPTTVLSPTCQTPPEGVAYRERGE